MPPPVKSRRNYGQDAAHLARLRAAVCIDSRVPSHLREKAYQAVDRLNGVINELVAATEVAESTRAPDKGAA